jgi:hypothetical protein
MFCIIITSGYCYLYRQCYVIRLYVGRSRYMFYGYTFGEFYRLLYLFVLLNDVVVGCRTHNIYIRGVR